MRHPFQCLVHARDPTDTASRGFVVAACGPRLLSVSLTSNEIVSQWPPVDSSNNAPAAVLNDVQSGGRPSKRQKTAGDVAPLPPKAPSVIKLAVSPNNRSLVAVTDDKYVRVFEAPEGRLAELSARPMPKRPCAIQVLPDNATILVADKFGDVYSLPLIVATLDDVHVEDQNPNETAAEKAFRVSASETTVHSQRNRKVLAAQLKQKNFTPRKEVLKFEHKLELGHVSMLTDMKCLTREVEGKQRAYIATSDRDEHIRISRGLPQAHVIEGFCLGHKEFVSKICQVGTTDLLVSGGGDDWLGVWNWQTFQLLKKFDVKNLVTGVTADAEARPAVSGIWSFTMPASQGADSCIVMACERVPALFIISRSALESPSKEGSEKTAFTVVSLPAAPLDVTAAGNVLLVAVDARADESKRLGTISVSVHDASDLPVQCSAWSPAAHILDLDLFNEHPSLDTALTDKELDSFLYPIANLRKRRDQEAQDEPDQD